MNDQSAANSDEQSTTSVPDPSTRTIEALNREVALLDQRIRAASELADEKLGRLRDALEALERQINATRTADQLALEKALASTEATTEQHEQLLRAMERRDETYVSHAYLDERLSTYEDKLRRVERGDDRLQARAAEEARTQAHGDEGHRTSGNLGG